MLINEIHHRVKNNLQVVSSLLGLQSRRMDDSHARDVLLESESRIHSMAMIHEMLYATDNLSTLKFSHFVRDLATWISMQFQEKYGNVLMNIHVPDVQFSIDTLIPCGLILNELLTNAFKYAFPEGEEGSIGISLENVGEGRYTLVVEDNGMGLSESLDIWRSRSLGLQIVRSMAAKLEGNLDVHRDGGSEFKVTFQEKRGK